MFTHVSKLPLWFSFFMVPISFLQAYNQWGERPVLSFFFLLLGVLLFVLSIIGGMVYKKRAITTK
ncbi:MAG TPA: hypothetical protein VEY51_11050 [Chondromyces sp.]|nr:hypothetical protein [Chondromyces sp.]